MSQTPPPLPPEATQLLDIFPAEAKAGVVQTKRHTALQPYMVGAAERAFESGLTQQAVARVLGISSRTMSRWLAEGGAEDCEDELLLSFFAASERGRGNHTAVLNGFMMAHAQDDPKACMEWLKINNAEWNPVKKVDIQASVSVKAPVDLTNVASREELRELSRLEELRAALEAKVGTR